MTVAGNSTIIIRADLSSLRSDMAHAKTTVTSATGGMAGSVSKSGGVMSKTFGKLGGAMGTAIKRGSQVGALAIVGIAGSAIKTAGAFDQSFRMIQATVGATGKQLQGLKKLAIDQGKATVFSANDAANAELELGKAGVSVADIQGGALKQTLALATAGGMGLADAATTAANAMNIFGLKGKDAQQVADALAGAANASSASVQSLSQGLAQGGQAASAAGLSIQQTTGLLGLFDNAGLKGADAGTSMKTMLNSLVPTTAKAKAAFKQYNIETVDSQGNFKSITNIAQQLKDKLGGLGEAQRMVALKTMFGTDAQRAANIMTKNGAAGLQKMIDASNKTGTAADVGKKRMSGFAGSLESLKGSVETLALKAGAALLPALKKLLDALIPLINGFGKTAIQLASAFIPIIAVLAKALTPIIVLIGKALVRAVRQLMPALKPLIAVMGDAFLKILKALEPVLPQLVRALSDLLVAVIPLIPIFAQLITFLVKLAASPLGAVIASLYVANKAFKATKAAAEGVKDGMKLFNFAMNGADISKVEGIPAKFASVTAQLKQNSTKALGIMKSMGSGIMSGVKGLATGMKAAFTGAMGAIKTAVMETTTYLMDNPWMAALAVAIIIVILIITHWKTFKKIIGAVWDWMKNAAKVVFGAVAKTISAAWSVIKKVTDAVWKGIKLAIGLVWKGIVLYIKTYIAVIKAIVTTVWNVIKGVTSTVWNGIKNLVGNVARTLVGLVTNPLQTIKNVWNNIWSGLKSTLSNIWNGIQSVIRGGINGVKSAINTVIGLINGFHLPGIHINPPGPGSIDWNGWSGFNIPYLAHGGIVTQPTLAMIGERGPEAVIPLARGTMPGGGDVINITIHALPEDTPLISHAVEAGVERARYRNSRIENTRLGA